MANVRLTAPMQHNGEMKEVDDVITDLSAKAAERLVRLGVGYIDDDVLSDDEGDIDGSESAVDEPLATAESDEDEVESAPKSAKQKKKKDA